MRWVVLVQVRRLSWWLLLELELLVLKRRRRRRCKWVLVQLLQVGALLLVARRGQRRLFDELADARRTDRVARLVERGLPRAAADLLVVLAPIVLRRHRMLLEGSGRVHMLAH